MITYDGHAWFSILLRLTPGSGTILYAILPQCLWSCFVAFLVWLFKTQVIDKAEGDDVKYWADIFPPDMTAWEMLAVVMGFLLVFRTNLSYGRYWEGRGHLGAIIKSCRNLQRQCLQCLPDSGVEDEVNRKLDMFFQLLMQHLRGETDEESVDKLTMINDFERQAIVVAQRKPLLPLCWLSQTLRGFKNDGLLTEREYCAMDRNIGDMISGFNGCDKIKSTPIPFPYAQLLVALLSVYISTFPVPLISYFETLPELVAVSFFVTFTLCGINAVGIEIEDPFGYDANDLNLEGMQATIQKDISIIGAKVKSS